MAHIHFKLFHATNLDDLVQQVNDYFEANPQIKLKDISGKAVEITTDVNYYFWLLFEH